MLKLHNTLSGKLEEFSPIDESDVRMYVCGPTVYDRAHIGNARPVVVFDILYRVLKNLYPKVTYVRNITDIDDKIYRTSLEKNISISKLTESTIKMYHEDMRELGVLDVDIEPRATQHIPHIINFIEKLIEKGVAYASNDHVYFDVSSFKNYGRLSKKDMGELISGSRVEISHFKKNPLDFVLWKPIDEKFNFGWNSPWGIGRPGWHIECSVMSKHYLGDTFDIHGGGIDLVFPHHENEIAQTCALTDNPFMARYWIHNGHLNINGVKMSKSLGNFLTVRELLKEHKGEVIKFAFLMTHYAAPINFSLEVLEQAKRILDRWYNSIASFHFEDSANSPIFEDVFDALQNDLNTPLAISILSSKVDALYKNPNQEYAQRFISTCRNLFGIMQSSSDAWFCRVSPEMKRLIDEKIAKRKIAKQNGEYELADCIRNELLEIGILIEDSKDGTTKWKTKA